MQHQTVVSSLAQDHMMPPALPGGADRSDVIVIEYDVARDEDGEPLVYSVISEDSLRHIPSDILAGVGISGEAFRQGDPAFFVGDDEHLRLYVDVDKFPTFIDDLADQGQEEGLKVFNSIGNLAATMNDAGMIIPPAVPAFVEMGLDQIDNDVAIAQVDVMRIDAEREKRAARDLEVDNDSSPGFY